VPWSWNAGLQVMVPDGTRSLQAVLSKLDRLVVTFTMVNVFDKVYTRRKNSETVRGR